MTIKYFIALNIGIFIQTIIGILEWENIFENKPKKLIRTFILLFLLGIFNNIIVPQNIKIISFFIFTGIIIKYAYKLSFSKTINALLTQTLISMVSEFIITTILSIILKDTLIPFLLTGKGVLTINILVSIIMYIAVLLSIPNKIFNFLTKITKKLKDKNKIFFTIILLITLNVVSDYSYYNYEKSVVLAINSVGTIIYTSIILYIFKVENKANDIKNKYNFNLNVLKEHEKTINKYKTNNHEHNNNLKTIKRMIEKDDPQVIDFINSMIKDNNKKQQEINETNNIHIRGLNSLIELKLTTMKENKIKYNLYVDKNIKDINIDDDTLLDVCKIVGVFLDNAIEEVKKNNNKMINIYIYQKENLYIEISNIYKEIDFKSKKGKNRGYGLKLVNQIISENKKLENLKKVTNNVFTQILIIKK